jgi:heat shock protein HtpX
MGNQLKTALLLTALIIWNGKLPGGSTGIVYAFFFALAMNLASYWFRDRIVLSMYRAQEAALTQSYSCV